MSPLPTRQQDARRDTRHPFVLGFDYPPPEEMELRRAHFDVDTVEEELLLLHDLGFNTIRLTLDWADLFCDPSTLRCTGLSHLLATCDAVGAEDLRVVLRSHGPGTNPPPRALLARVAQAVGSHGAVVGYELGDLSGLIDEHWSTEQAGPSLKERTSAICAASPNHAITASIPESWLHTQLAFNVHDVCSALSGTVIALEDGCGDALSPAAFERARIASSLGQELFQGTVLVSAGRCPHPTALATQLLADGGQGLWLTDSLGAMPAMPSLQGHRRRPWTSGSGMADSYFSDPASHYEAWRKLWLAHPANQRRAEDSRNGPVIRGATR